MGWKIPDKITAIPQDNDLVPFDQGGILRKSTWQKIKEYMLGAATLKTTSQEVIGAVNELKETSDSHNAELENHASQLSDMEQQKADKTALNATNANVASNANSIVNNATNITLKADLDYVNAKFSSMGNTKTFKGSCTYTALQALTGMLVDDYWYVTDYATNYCYNGTSWIDIGNNLKIANGTIIPEKTTFFNAKNVFNPATITSGYYTSGTTFTALATACYSDKIPVKAGDVVSVFNFSNSTFGGNVGAIYNSSDVAISALTGTNKSAESITISGATASYIRVNCLLTNVNKFMVAINQAIIKFVPYGENSLLDSVKIKPDKFNQVMSGYLTMLEPDSSYTLYPPESGISQTQINSLNTIKTSITTTGYCGIKRAIDAWYIKVNKIRIKLKAKIVADTYPITVTPFIVGYPNITFDSGTGTGTTGSTISVADTNVVEIDQVINFNSAISIKGLVYGLQVLSGTCDCYINQMVVEFDNVNDDALYGKILTGNGDSICYGAGEAGGYIKLIAQRHSMIYENVAVSGATIASGTKYSNGSDRHWICDTITDMNANADYVLLEGGFNDFENSVPLGAITVDYTTPVDKTTFYGALEYMFRIAHTHFTNPKVNITFVIQHNANDLYYAHMNGVYYMQFYNAIKEVCKKYGIKVVNLFAEAQCCTAFDRYKVLTYNSDGLHPLKDMYLNYYVEPIEAKMKAA